MSVQRGDGPGGETMRGVVTAYNFSPKGEVDGLILRDEGRTFQVNIPPHARAALLTGATIGGSVSWPVEPEPATAKHPEGHHPVYRLRDPGKPEAHHPAPPGPGRDAAALVKGIVARLNYAKHGEANGVVLDGGDFVHLRPGGMKLLRLDVGQEVSAEGEARPMADGRRAIEARIVNEVALPK